MPAYVLPILMKRLINWYKNLPGNAKGMIILAVLLIIAILFSWERVWEAVKEGLLF